eukprot:UN00714
MAVTKILEKCETLPGGFVLLSDHQEQGIYHLENWHETTQQNMITELIETGFLDSDCETSDDETNGEEQYPETSDDDGSEYVEYVKYGVHKLQKQLKAQIRSRFELLSKVSVTTTLSLLSFSYFIHYQFLILGIKFYF